MNMQHKLTIRISKVSFNKLQNYAAQSGVSISEAIRRKLSEWGLSEKEETKELEKKTPQTEKLHLIHIENNLFLRELAFDRNSQIIDRVQTEIRRYVSRYGAKNK